MKKKPASYSQMYRRGMSTKKLFLVGALVFGFALSVSASSTFAWYTISERYHIAGLKMTVDSSDQYLKLGKMDRETGQVVFQQEGDEPYTLEDFYDEVPKLGNISNMYNETSNGAPIFYNGYPSVGGVHKTTQAEDGFVQFELYFECSQDALIYLTDASYASPNYEENARVARQKDIDPATLNNVVEAARISFYSETKCGYNIAELGETHEDVDYYGVLDIHGTGSYDVDAESQKEILYGQVRDDASIAYKYVEEDIVVDGPKNVFNSTHKAGTQMVDFENSVIPEAKEHARLLKDYFYDYESMADNANEHPLLVVRKNTPTKLVISIYLEGWDHDMTEALGDSSFNFGLGFLADMSTRVKDYL